MDVPSLARAAVSAQERCCLTLNTNYSADLLFSSLSPSLSLCISGVSVEFWRFCCSKASPSHTCEHPLAMEDVIVHFIQNRKIVKSHRCAISEL